MAKYRITSIPQAKKGKIVKSDNTPMVEVQGVQQPSYWNESLPGYMRGEGCPPGKYEYNGECLTETEYIAASNAEMNKEQADYDTKNLARKIDFVKDINDIRSKTNEERARWEADNTNRYLETFAKSKKQDKIEPYKKFPETEVTPELEAEFKNNFLVHKKDGFVELFPKNIVQDRIITNGFQADQFKNYWGLDPEQVKEQLGDLMGVAKANYEEEVTKNILTKAIEQGKPVDQVIKGLSPKLGKQSNLKATFEKPTNKIINDAFSELYNNIDSIPGSDPSKVEQDRKIFLESSDPMDAWERKYHSGPNNLGDFLTYQSKKIERGENAYSDWMDKYGKSGQYDGLTFAKDDAMANVRNTNMLRNQNLNQKNASAAANTAKAEDYTKAVGEYVSNLGMDTTKQVLKQALDAAGSNSKTKLEILKSFQENPNDAMQKLLGQKTGNKKQTYNDVLNERVNTLFTLNQNRDTMKQGTGINENTTASKIRDVLTNPFDAAYFAMNPREEMWGNSNLSYDTRKDIQNETGVDMGLIPNDNPLSIIRDYTLLQAANPFKIGSNLRKGYDKGEFLSAAGDELFDIGTKVGLMKGLNAITKGSKWYKPNLVKPLVSNIFANPISQLSYYANAPGSAASAYNNYQKGNYGTAALDALTVLPAIAGAKNTIKTLNTLKTPGTMIANLSPESRYAFTYNAATPGSGIFMGNPSTAIPGIGQPKFQSITKPINTLSKGLGFGEFNINKVNPGWRVPQQPMNTNLLGYSDGGLVKGQTGLIVKGLQALGNGLVKANLGRIVKTGSDISKLLKPTSEFRSTISGLDDVVNLPVLIPNMRNVSKPLMNSIQQYTHKLPLMDSHIINLTQSPTDLGGTSLIKFGTEPHPGDEWYNIDPADYQGLDWKKEGLKDANDSISKYMSGLPQYGKDTFKGVGDFDFKDFSDGWEARQAMMNIGTDPQWVPGKNDFYTENELTNLVNQQSDWQAARNAFDDMEPEDPGMAIFSALSGDNSREELFSNLFPNASMPNFRSKFTTPSQEALLQQHLPWQYSVRNQGMLNSNSLKNVNGIGDTLPRTYQDLLKAQKDNFLTTAPAKDVVMEMRGGLSLKIEDIQNATPEQLEKWRKQIVQKMNRQVRDRWTRDLSNPFTGGNAFKQISDVPVWKNKKGGVVTSLSRKEIDKYIKDGYIIEDE